MVKIVTFNSSYSEAFQELNYAWINEHFKVEESDRKMLSDPEEYIINKGGEVLIALLNEEPVGTCALIKMDDQTFELAKMAVAKEARGHQIGYLLGKSIIEKAKEKQGRRLFLETNSVLTPAINLYKKLGFTEIDGGSSPYERCNVQMELLL